MFSESIIRTTALTAIALAGAFALAACRSSTETSASAAGSGGEMAAASADDVSAQSASATVSADGSIIDTLGTAGSFSVLLTALEATGLAATLGGDGTYTLFAPTDAAFAALPPGTVDALLLPQNQARLRQILSYHVIAGSELTATQVAGQTMSVATLEGRDVSVNGSNGFKVDNATVTSPDVDASNGVIHVIDTVLIP
ncbi:MAG: fasciclin domain-containing protein [Alphaproteobacteria bacterium]